MGIVWAFSVVARPLVVPMPPGFTPLSKTKPILGLAGGIGSGKSAVARLLGTMGGYVIDADAIAKETLGRPEVRDKLVEWWGPDVLDSQGWVDRRRVSERVFDDPEQRQRLEALIHPLVSEERRKRVESAEGMGGVRFIVLDVPLLFEVGLDKACDELVFVEAAPEVRLRRVTEARGWDREELERREKNQWPPQRKKAACDDIIVNNGDESQCLSQVHALLNRIFPGH